MARSSISPLPDSFGVRPLSLFRAELVAHEPASWEELFAGFSQLRAITFSSSLPFLVELAQHFTDAEIVFGSEKILSNAHIALAQASQTVADYGFVDALADHKVLTEGLARLLDRSGRTLLERVAAGSLRFRLLRGRPSHEKLYLLSAPNRHRVVTGSANLSQAAFAGWQREVVISFDGEPAWRQFSDYYQRDEQDSIPIASDALVSVHDDGSIGVRETPLQLEEIPIVRAVEAGLVIVEQPQRPFSGGFSADALRAAAALGAELKELVLPPAKRKARQRLPPLPWCRHCALGGRGH